MLLCRSLELVTAPGPSSQMNDAARMMHFFSSALDVSGTQCTISSSVVEEHQVDGENKKPSQIKRRVLALHCEELPNASGAESLR